MDNALRLLLSPVAFAIYAYLGCVSYIHFRGRERLRFNRQLVEHSGLLSPYNTIMYVFSAVAPDPILKREDFPQLDPLRDNWHTIRDEARALWEGGSIRPSENHDDLAFLAFYKRGWKRFHLKWYGDALPSARALCPKTVELVNSIPELKSAAFTLLPPGAKLGRHRDPFAGSLRYHLGLITPNSDACAIWIDGEEYSWRDGEDIVFDETYIHWAENATDETRIILFCDFNRPLHTPVVRALNRVVQRVAIAATASRNTPDEKAGLLNRLTPRFYGLGSGLRSLKASCREAYYSIKFALILSLMLFAVLGTSRLL